MIPADSFPQLQLSVGLCTVLFVIGLIHILLYEMDIDSSCEDEREFARHKVKNGYYWILASLIFLVLGIYIVGFLIIIGLLYIITTLLITSKRMIQISKEEKFKKSCKTKHNDKSI